MTLLLLAALVAPPAEPKPPLITLVMGGGVATPNEKFVAVPGKEGVELLDIATGKPAWVNKEVSKVAGASDKVVLAWSADEKKPFAFRVFVLDAETGKTLTKSDPIEMPDWAVTGHTHGRSFRTGARVEQGAVLVVWQANAFYAGGAAPSPEILKAARKEAVGVASIDMKTGKISALERKPKPEEFGTNTNKVGDYDVSVTEMLQGKPMGFAGMTTVKMTVLKDKKTLWTRELAGNPFSPPPP
jgi:hypothetical protein